MRNGSRGQVIIVFVLCLSVLLGFAALAIDVGYLFSVRGELQRCADAAALAGAYVFHDGSWYEGTIPGGLKDKAESRAKIVASQDPVGDKTLAEKGKIDVFFDKGVNNIRVTTQRELDLFFAGIFGIPTVTLSATATAEAESVDQNVMCFAPIAIPFDPTVKENDDDEEADSLENIFFKQGNKRSYKIALPFTGGNVDPDKVKKEAGDNDDKVKKLFILNLCGGDIENGINNPCAENCVFTLDESPAPLANESMIPSNLGSIFNSLVQDSDGFEWKEAWGILEHDGDIWMYEPRLMRVMVYDWVEAKANGNIKIIGFTGYWIKEVKKPAGINRDVKLIGKTISADAVGHSSDSPDWPPDISGKNIPSLKTTRLVK